MISIQEAQNIILEQIKPVAVESVPLLQCVNRVCAEPCYAPWDIPPVANSEMDGYAFSHAALTGNRLPVTGFVPAGTMRTVPVPAGEAVKIMTGAPIPPGCDTVVPIEEVEVEGDEIRLTGRVVTGACIRAKGDDVCKDELVISAGTLLRPQEIGMLSAMGKTVLGVYRKVQVAIISTGDELLDPGSVPQAGKIIDSNSYSLAAQVLDAGGDAIMLGIAADNREATRQKVQAGLQGDFLVLAGGVSVGDRDFVKETIEALGGEMKFWRVNIKPGKPMAFAILQGKPVFALPGNPVAAMVTFEQFVRPALLKAMGHRSLFRPVVSATLREPLTNNGSRPHLVRGVLTREGASYGVVSTGRQGSNRLSSLIQGNSLIFVPPNASLPVGEPVQVQLLGTEYETKGFTGA
jgi:molybdopterin molybdotransferase